MADLNIRPLADRVIIEPAAAETKTASGIIIPDTAQEKPQRGTVVAVGPGKKDEPMTVSVGDEYCTASTAVLNSSTKAVITSLCAKPISWQLFNPN